MPYNYESAVLHDNYEVSIWDDVYDQSLQRFTEQKVAVIGSNTMTAQTRVIDPTLIENINGTKTLTFSIYYRYIDNYDGTEKINPFIKLLIVERKIKLHWKGEWYDFIIKQRVESSDRHSFIYTCESLAANELTKTGYHIEFDTELSNNTDTIWNLAQTVLDGTDWRLNESAGKNFRETVVESGYKVNVSPALNNQSSVLLFYNTVFAAQQSLETSGTVMVQVWAGDLNNADSNGVLTTGECITTSNGIFSKSGNNITFTFSQDNSTYTCTYSGQSIYTYRAKRDVLQQLTVFSPPLNRYVGKYMYNGNLVYGYTTAEFVSPEVVTNLIINDKDFYKTDGWFNADEFTIWPLYDATQAGFDVDTYNPKGYLLSKNNKLGNNCFLHNSNYIPDGLVNGDKLIVRLKLLKATYNSSDKTYNIASATINTTASINKYSYDSTTHTYVPSTASENVYGSVTLTNQDGWLVGELPITQTLSRTDMLTQSIALFFNFNTALSANEYYAIEEAQFYFKRINGQGEIITPNSIDETSVITYTSKYFSPAQNTATTAADDINWLYIGTSHTSEIDSKWSAATPVLDESCEKIRTIAGKNSTRYNWLQTLAETFEVWCRFWVVHNEDGTIKYETIDNVTVPMKYVTFVERVGIQADYGFVYGIDLKSIQRTIDSNALATKIIVPQNSNQYAQDGFCTIQRSEENYSKENYILNFDYYADNNLIDRGKLYTDLYEARNDSTGALGYYQELHRLNNEYDTRAELIESLKTDLDKQQAYYNVYSDLRDSAINEINSINYQITTLISVDHENEPTGYDSSNVEEFMENNPNWEKLVSLYKTKNELLRSVEVYTTTITGLETSIDLINTQLYDEDDGLVHLQEINREDRQSIVDTFNKRYSRYIQEGTWQSEDYVDDTQYYLDGQAVAYTSARPKLTYNISVIRISALEDFKNKIFRLGDISWVEDEEFFMARYREEVVVTQVVSHLDMPENDTITVQNYRTQFQDLFQRTESTIQSFQYGEGSYNRVAQIMESDGTINVQTLQNSIAANNFLMNQSGLNNSVTTGPDGITVTDLTDISNKVRITANGVFISTDGGANWINAIRGSGVSTEALSAGIISVRDIVIDGGQGNTFRWDDKGISAYYFDNESQIINTSHYLRLDRFGVYGILDQYEFNPTSEQEVFDEASFGMTWNRFFMKNKYDTHYVEISSTNDIRVVDTTGLNESERIKIGKLSSNPDLYGIRISDDNGNAVMETSNNGTLWLRDVLYVGTTPSGNFAAKLGYLPVVTNSQGQIIWGTGQSSVNLDTRTIDNTVDKIHRTIDINNKFVVWEDGTVYAKDGYFEGTVNATSGTFTGTIVATGGQIGNLTIGEVEALPGQISDLTTEVDELKTFDISSNMGYTYTVRDGIANPATITLDAVAHGFDIDSGTNVTWYGSTDITAAAASWHSFGTGLHKDFTYPITIQGTPIFDTYINYYIKAVYTSGSDSMFAYTTLNMVKDGEDGESPLLLLIESSTGNLFINRDIDATLTATVWKGTEDVTSEYIGSFRWTKYDANGENPVVLDGETGRSITIDDTDIYKKARFVCEIISEAN